MIVRALESTLARCASNPDLAAFLGADRPLQARDSMLVTGEDYLVVAVAFGPWTPWFFVSDRHRGLRYPIPTPSPLVSVRDSRPAKSWRWSTWTDRDGDDHALLAPDPWARAPGFHARLFDGERDALDQWEPVVTSLMMEWPLPWVSAEALSLGNGDWVTDPMWVDSWEADPTLAMTINPTTGEWFRNPHFDKTA